MELALAAFPGVITTCLLVWLLLEILKRQHEERASHRIEISALSESHREEVAALNQARVEEVANLCQRIQAPEVAVAAHAAEGALPDPPAVDLEDDDALIRASQERMDNFANDLLARQ